MNDNELLQEILNKLDGLDKGQEALRQDVSGLKAGQELLQQDVTNLKQGQESLQQQIVKTNIILENDISKKLGALFDGHQLDSEKIQSIKDSIEAIEEVVDANDTLTKVNALDIRKLKEKIG